MPVILHRSSGQDSVRVVSVVVVGRVGECIPALPPLLCVTPTPFLGSVVVGRLVILVGGSVGSSGGSVFRDFGGVLVIPIVGALVVVVVVVLSVVVVVVVGLACISSPSALQPVTATTTTTIARKVVVVVVVMVVVVVGVSGGGSGGGGGRGLRGQTFMRWL